MIIIIQNQKDNNKYKKQQNNNGIVPFTCQRKNTSVANNII